MDKNSRFYITCISFFLTVPIIILAIGFMDTILGRTVTMILMAVSFIIIRKFPLEITGDLYDLEADLSITKKAMVLSAIVLGAVIGTVLSVWLGFF